MRAVIQRVSQSSVVIGGVCHGEIGTGLNILIGIEEGDGMYHAEMPGIW